MKRIFLSVVASTFVLMPNAFADNIAIECGTGLNKEEGTIAKVEFALSSQGDSMAGTSAIEGKWHLDLRSQRNVKNFVVKADPRGDILVFVKLGSSMGGDVGMRYVIKNAIRSEFTQAIPTIVGGFAGGNTLPPLDCAVFQD